VRRQRWRGGRGRKEVAEQYAFGRKEAIEVRPWYAAGQHDDQVLLGVDGNHLATLTDCGIEVRADPPEIAIGADKLKSGFRWHGDAWTSRCGDPGRLQELVPIPCSLVQVEIAEPGHIVRMQAQSPKAEVHPLRIGRPYHCLDAEGLEEVPVRQVRRALARRCLDDPRQEVDTR